MEFKEIGSFESIGEVITANKRAGHHHFDPDTMSYWNGRLEPAVYGGHYIIDSLQSNDEGEARIYKVRAVFADGHIESVCGIRGYASLMIAVIAASTLVAFEAKYPIQFINTTSGKFCQYTDDNGMYEHGASAKIGDVYTCQDHMVEDCRDYMRLNG